MLGKNKNTIISLEEKIDYIYNQMQASKKERYLRLLLKFILIGFVIFFILKIWPTLDQTVITEQISENISKSITPVIQTIVEDMLENIDINNLNIDKNNLENIPQ